MAMTRSALLTYLVNQYGTLVTLTGQLATDTAGGYGPALDDTFLQLGTEYADLATAEAVEADIQAARVLSRYHALRHFEQRLAVKVDFDVVGASASVQKKLSAQLQQVRALLAEAAAHAQALGYTVVVGTSGPGILTSVRYNSDVPFRTSELIP